MGDKYQETVGSHEEILRKYDKESDFRVLTGFPAKIIAAIAITFSLFHLYTAVFGVLDAMIQRSIHLAFGLCLIFLLYLPEKTGLEKSPSYRYTFAILGAAAPIYIIVFISYFYGLEP